MATVVTLLFISLVFTVVTVILLATVMRDGETVPPPAARQTTEAPGFFESELPRVIGDFASPVPEQPLLASLENYVRLEQMAAEVFHSWPTVESLHRRAMSPLVH